MKKTLFSLFIGLFATALQLAAQQPLSGSLNFPGLGSGNRAIWDVTGTYIAGGTIETGDGGGLELQFPMTVVQDGKGKLTGAGTGVPVTIGSDHVTGNYTVKGTLSGTGANTTVTITVKLTGSGNIQGATRSYSASITYNLHVDPATSHLVGTGTGTAGASGVNGKAQVNAQVDVPLPNGMNGTWSLTLNLQVSRNKYTGTANITLSNGRALAFTLSGTFAPTTGSSALKLSGTGTGSGAKLGVNTTGNPPQLTSVTGNALGRTLN